MPKTKSLVPCVAVIIGIMIGWFSASEKVEVLVLNEQTSLEIDEFELYREIKVTATTNAISSGLRFYIQIPESPVAKLKIVISKDSRGSIHGLNFSLTLGDQIVLESICPERFPENGIITYLAEFKQKISKDDIVNSVGGLFGEQIPPTLVVSKIEYSLNK